MEEEKGIKDNVEEVKENLQVGPSLTAGAEPREEGSMVLRTEDLVKKYGKRTVVSHVSIDVKQGEIVGLLGPNGAGKTTSFYMTVGLITPNEGRIFLNDLDTCNFRVLGYDVEVKDALIAEALNFLSDKKREVVLLAYFLDMSDTEIAKLLNLRQSTIHYHRTSSLKSLKEFLEERTNED